MPLLEVSQTLPVNGCTAPCVHSIKPHPITGFFGSCFVSWIVYNPCVKRRGPRRAAKRLMVFRWVVGFCRSSRSRLTSRKHGQNRIPANPLFPSLYMEESPVPACEGTYPIVCPAGPTQGNANLPPDGGMRNQAYRAVKASALTSSRG